MPRSRRLARHLLVVLASALGVVAFSRNFPGSGTVFDPRASLSLALLVSAATTPSARAQMPPAGGLRAALDANR